MHDVRRSQVESSRYCVVKWFDGPDLERDAGTKIARTAEEVFQTNMVLDRTQDTLFAAPGGEIRERRMYFSFPNILSCTTFQKQIEGSVLKSLVDDNMVLTLDVRPTDARGNVVQGASQLQPPDVADSLAPAATAALIESRKTEVAAAALVKKDEVLNKEEDELKQRDTDSAPPLLSTADLPDFDAREDEGEAKDDMSVDDGEAFSEAFESSSEDEIIYVGKLSQMIPEIGPPSPVNPPGLRLDEEEMEAKAETQGVKNQAGAAQSSTSSSAPLLPLVENVPVKERVGSKTAAGSKKSEAATSDAPDWGRSSAVAAASDAAPEDLEEPDSEPEGDSETLRAELAVEEKLHRFAEPG